MNRAQMRAAQAAVAMAKRRAEAFRLERNFVLRSLEPKMMDAFFLKYRKPLPKAWATDKPDAQLACMHFARIQLPDDMSAAERLTSAKWLVDNTYSLPSGYTLEGDALRFNVPNDPDGAKPNFGMDGPVPDKDKQQ